MEKRRKRKQARNPHTVVLADVENLVGSAAPTNAEIIWAERNLNMVFDTTGALVHVASSHRAAKIVRFAWSGGRHWWRSGPDGADLALIEAGETELPRAHTLVIASGDGIFAEIAARAASAGLRVVVISNQRSLSNRLRLAAHEIRYMPLPIENEEALRVAA